MILGTATAYNTGLPAPVASLLPPNPRAVTPFAEGRKWRASPSGSATRNVRRKVAKDKSAAIRGRSKTGYVDHLMVVSEEGLEVSHYPSVLRLQKSDLAEMVAQRLGGKVQLLQMDVEKTTKALGGRSGSEAALVRVRTDRPQCQELSLIVKLLPVHYAFEADAFEALAELGAPVAPFYGQISHDDGQRTLVIEFLPFSVGWPIPASYHMKWATSVARLCALRFPDPFPLKRAVWSSRRQEFLSGLQEAVRFDDEVLQRVLVARGLHDLSIVEARLGQVLDQAEALPVALNHGELYVHHTGQREPEGEVLFYDLNGASLGPRFSDFVAVIIDHGEPYEAKVDALTLRFLEEYKHLTGASLDSNKFHAEIRLTRALVSLTRMRLILPWFKSLIREGQDTGEFFTSPRKWIVLHLEALHDYLKLWSDPKTPCLPSWQAR